MKKAISLTKWLLANLQWTSNNHLYVNWLLPADWQ